MGLLAFLRGHSSKDIRLKQDISQYLVFPYNLKQNRIWLNKKAVVPQNTLLAIATRGKVLDMLPTGEHTLGAVLLPNSSAKFKLYKLDKNGKAITDFKGYAYFINLLPRQNFQFSTYKKIRYKNEIDGKFKVGLDFNFDYEVKDVQKLMKSLLSEYAYLKNGEAEDILESWLSDFATTELERTAYRRADFEQRINEVEALLSAKLTKMVAKVGLQNNQLRVREMSLSKARKTSQNPLLNDQNNEIQQEEFLEQTEIAQSVEQPYIYDEVYESGDETMLEPTQQLLEREAICEQYREQAELENIVAQENVLAQENIVEQENIMAQENIMQEQQIEELPNNPIMEFEKVLQEEDTSVGWRGLESIENENNMKNITETDREKVE